MISFIQSTVAGARGLVARTLNAEALARLVQRQVVVQRLAVVEAVQVAVAVLGADVEADAFLRRTTLRLDRDNTVGGTRAVQRGAGGALHDFDRLDVEAPQFVEAADVQDRAVNNDERTLACDRSR